VIVDLAAEAGGNCELTAPARRSCARASRSSGCTNLPSTMPFHASQLYARNVLALLHHLAPEGELALDWDDEITAGACVTASRRCRVRRCARPRPWTNRHESRAPGTDTRARPVASAARAAGQHPHPGWGSGSRATAPAAARVRAVSHNTLLVFELTILVLAIFLGFEVISKVPTLLHTPLMSGTNAIHGIVVVGAMLVLGPPHKDTFDWIVGFLASCSARRTSSAASSSPTACSRCSRSASREAADASRDGQTAMSTNLANLLYLIPIVAFILALRFLSNPRTRGAATRSARRDARRVVVTWIKTARRAGGRSRRDAIGGGFGAVAARRVKMTAMPQMVALFNGVGGGAAALIALAEFHESSRARPPEDRHLARDRALRADRRDLVRRLDGRVREAAGADQRPADHVSGPAVRQRRCSRGCVALGIALVAASRTSGCSGRSSPPRCCSGFSSCSRSAAPTCQS
jgi:hypothetical protein